MSSSLTCLYITKEDGIPREIGIIDNTSIRFSLCYGNRDKLRLADLLGSSWNFTYLLRYLLVNLEAMG